MTGRKNRIKPLRLGGLPLEIRQRIKTARRRKGWSQRELGNVVGLPQSHVSGIESGEVTPRFDTLLDLVRVLDFDLLPVPRSLVPAVQALLRAQMEPGSEEKPLYAAVEDDAENKKRDET